MDDARIRAAESLLMTFARAVMGLVLIAFVCSRPAFAVQDPKLKVAVFPLSGNASDTDKERVEFALRSKINREGTFEAIDGPTMADLAGGPIALDATIELLKTKSESEKPTIFIWGELSGQDQLVLKLKLLDLRQPDAEPHAIEKVISQPQQLRFAIEGILENITGMKVPAHPDQSSVQDDPASAALWKSNPNLIVDGDFSQADKWWALRGVEKKSVQIATTLPQPDQVCLNRLPTPSATEAPHHVLAMRLSSATAQSTGLACISEAFKIEPETRYRLSYRYRSDGPNLHVFVKGYFKGTGIDGKPADIEVYRRQVPPGEQTDGKWVTVVDDLTPQNAAHPVETLRVDLYAYADAGLVMFEDVTLKAIGPAKPDIGQSPTTQP